LCLISPCFSRCHGCNTGGEARITGTVVLPLHVGQARFLESEFDTNNGWYNETQRGAAKRTWAHADKEGREEGR
jgi:hypothetical protein